MIRNVQQISIFKVIISHILNATNRNSTYMYYTVSQKTS